jgi:hypothetical protein
LRTLSLVSAAAAAAARGVLHVSADAKLMLVEPLHSFVQCTLFWTCNAHRQTKQNYSGGGGVQYTPISRLGHGTWHTWKQTNGAGVAAIAAAAAAGTFSTTTGAVGGGFPKRPGASNCPFYLYSGGYPFHANFVM